MLLKVGSDEYGAHIHIGAAKPNQGLVTAHISYIEVIQLIIYN